jgi:4-carboxymuconolactone decarboxylase
MSRLPPIDRDALGAEGQAVWDRIASGRYGRAEGPYTMLLRRPDLADRVANLGDYFRGASSLSQADVELSILAAVREVEAPYAWARHEVRGRQVGTRAEAIEILRARGDLAGLTDRERLIVEITHELLRTRNLSDALFARGLDGLGEDQLVELVTLVGHYTLIGYILNAFHIPPPPDWPTY